MSTFRTLVNNLFKKKFDIKFLGNKKSCQSIEFFFFPFPIQTFFNWIVNQCSKGTR